MDSWRDDLEKVMNSMADSKKLTNYEEVKSLFGAVYNEIIEEPYKRNTSFFHKQETDDNKTYFYIHDYALCVAKNRRKIDVFAIDDTSEHGEKKDLIAEIEFIDNFAKFKFIVSPTADSRSFYLGRHYIDQLFKLAYKPLIS